MKKQILVCLLFLDPAVGFAQQKNYSVGPALQDNSASAELSSFEIAAGYEVSLFASEENGIANPIVMRWGPRGRLWVLCSLVYPQALPTKAPGDKLFILQDNDRDGRVDETLVFADGLDMPTGFAIGNGGVYLGQGQDLLFLRDENGDDRADTREVLLTGFGTGDTHQNINSLTWTPGGELLFCQGLHNFSRVETPWGIVRMDEHGVWRLRPRRMQLHAFRGCSGQNPWGLSHGHWGEPFAKSNGNAVSELLPVMIHAEHRHQPLDIGGTRIKSMICEIIDSPALPDDLQGNIVIAGYFAHLVDRLKITTDGAGHKGELLDPLWRTDHQSFRPVDVQTGPDGALYVADWYNPIIGHYQASLRHPNRDKKHGRIWRVTAKGKKTVERPQYDGMPTRNLLDALRTAPLKERERLRMILSNRYRDPEGAGPLEEELAAWVSTLDPDDPRFEHHLFEALCLYEWFETVNVSLLNQLLGAREPLARAYATRVVGRWHDRLQEPLRYLEKSAADPHPRVRLEAVVAASQFQSAEAMAVAARVLEAPTDRFLEAALRQCAHALQPWWFAALQEGKLAISDAGQLAFLLQQTTGQGAAGIARAMLEEQTSDRSSPTFATLAKVLATQGTIEDIEWLVALAYKFRENATPALAALVESARLRNLKPRTSVLPLLLVFAVESGTTGQRMHALQLIGHWNLRDLGDRVIEASLNPRFKPEVRIAAVEAMGRLPDMGESRLNALSRLLDKAEEVGLRHAALDTLAGIDPVRAARIAAGALATAGKDDPLEPYLVPFLTRKGGDVALAATLKETGLKPELRARIQGALGATGVLSPALSGVLEAAGPARRKTIGMPAYSEQWINMLAAEVRAGGDAKHGSEIYHRDSLACTRCHLIDGCGLDFGPELTAVGAGLPVEIIIESVVWPRRQIKEGYLSTTITTRDDQVVSGHLKHEDKQRIVIEDAATRTRKTLAPGNVAQRQDAGTVMPPGLTSQLNRKELRDLIRFLSEQKGK